MGEKLKFENESRLLSDDEKQLIGVLKSFRESILDLQARVAVLELTRNATPGSIH